MSHVETILKAIDHHGTSTYTDLEANTGIPRNKLRWACADLKRTKRVTQGEDDVTNEITFKITPAGRLHIGVDHQSNSSVKTPAGGGEITPAAAVATTSLATRSTVADPAVVEPPTPEASPAAAGSDEIDTRTLHSNAFSAPPDDDSDPIAFPRSRRIICSASTDGQTTIHRVGDRGIVLTAEETRTVYEFLGISAPIWVAALS